MKAYPEQIEAANVAAKAGRGTICMPTGVGKSVTMAILINKLQLKTLVIVPNLELKRQLRESFTKFFGNLNSITIENIDSKDLNIIKDYDCLIIDEAHHVAAKTYRRLNKKVWNNIYYRFFFTATPWRSNSEEQLLFESIAGNVIYRVDYRNSVDKGYICPMESYYFELPKIETDGVKWSEVYSDLVVENSYRNRLISDLLVSLEVSKTSTLCLVKEIRHGQILSEMAGIEFVHGERPDTNKLIDKFNSGEIKALIGTVGVLGEGIDTRPAEYIIIAGLGRSKNAFMQNVGRGFRRFNSKESCKIILFKDLSHKFTKSHFSEQCKILKEEYGQIPIKLKNPE